MIQENIKKYHPLGQKTLFMLILKRSIIFFSMLPILFLGLFFLHYVPSQYLDTVINVIFAYATLLLLTLLSVVLVGWLQYFRYWIFIDDKDLKIARGLIAIEQLGIPFRRIKDVKIKRSLLDQLFGVSDIIITALGGEEHDADENESIIILPSLEERIALEIQDIVLKKTQVEQIHVLGGQRVN